MASASLIPVPLEDLDSSIASPLRAATERLGYYGEMFQYLANGPAALSAFLTYTGALRSTLDPKLNELIALTVCTRMNFAYERIQHENLSLMLGYAREWVAALIGKGTRDILSEDERATQDFVVALIDRRHDDARAGFAQMVDTYGSAQAVAMLFQTARFIDICTIGLLLQAELPITSSFADG